MIRGVKNHALGFKQHPNCKRMVFQAFLFRQTKKQQSTDGQLCKHLLRHRGVPGRLSWATKRNKQMSKANHFGAIFPRNSETGTVWTSWWDSLTSPYPLAFLGGDQKICMKNWMWSFGSHRIFFSGKSVNGYITKTRNNLHSKRPLDCSCWISRSCVQPRKFVKIICLTQNQQHPIKKRGLFKGEPKTCLV